MPQPVLAVLVVVVGYLLGSIPTAYVAGRRQGVDVRVVDTGIAGASNVFRHVSRSAGVLVAVLDIGKGAAAVGLARAADLGPWMVFAAGAAAVMGHWWPVFTGFHGGIGAAAAIGGVAAVLPVPVLVGVPFALVALFWARKPSPAATTLLVVAVITGVVLGVPIWQWAVSAGLSLMILARALLWHAPQASGPAL